MNNPVIQTIDPRIEGLYFKWMPNDTLAVAAGEDARTLVLEYVEGDGSVRTMLLTEWEADQLKRFLFMTCH